MKRYIPLLTTLSQYRKGWFLSDLSAGLTVGVMLIPQGMAYAMLAGLPPIYGLYASTVPLLVYAILGTSRQLSTGPVAIISLLVASGVGAISIQGTSEYISLAIMMAVMVGVLQFFLGLFRVGSLINLMPHSMIAGFTSGAAFIIIGSQLKSLLGISVPRGSFLETIYYALVHITDINVITTLISVSALIILVIGKKWKSKFPFPLITICASILLVSIFEWNESGVKIIEDVPIGLPSFSIPLLEWNTILILLPTAITIALVGYMESIAVAKSIQERRKNYELDYNQELIALGLANIFGSLFQSYPTTGGFSRTAVNDQAGAKSGIASIISGILIITTLLFLTKYFYNLPMAVLAAIIVVAVIGLIDTREAIHLLHSDKGDFTIFIITASSTIILGVESGLILGVVSSIIFRLIFKRKIYASVTNVTNETQSLSEI